MPIFFKTSRPKSCQALTPSTCHLDLRTELAWSRGSRASGVQRHFPSKKSVVFFPKGSTQIYIGDRWWFQIWFLSSPTWGNDPIGLIFFRWVEKSDMSFWCLVKKKTFVKSIWANQNPTSANLTLHPWKLTAGTMLEPKNHPIEVRTIESSKPPFWFLGFHGFIINV